MSKTAQKPRALTASQKIDAQAEQARNGTYRVFVQGIGLRRVEQLAFEVKLRDGRVQPIAKSSIEKIEKVVRNGLRNELAELAKAKERVDKRARTIAEVLRSGDIGFFDFADLLVEHWYNDDDVPGFEAVPKKRGRFSYVGNRGYSAREKLQWLLRQDYKGNPENDEFFSTEGRSRFWHIDDADHKDKLKPGVLGSKKLRDLKTEDVYVRVVKDESGEVVRRAPRDTTVHSFVREILGVAVDMGLIDENPASLRVHKKRAS